jgi:hypothetical protein
MRLLQTGHARHGRQVLCMLHSLCCVTRAHWDYIGVCLLYYIGIRVMIAGRCRGPECARAAGCRHFIGIVH